MEREQLLLAHVKTVLAHVVRLHRLLRVLEKAGAALRDLVHVKGQRGEGLRQGGL